ncbi:MAG TPA: VOC family protein [Acidimicrobiales bacterium]|nr:VOC family protein [Acidimicrobiales bacterium]
MSAINDIVFDCRHAASLARFWAAVLDGYQVAPYDEEELARLASRGITDTEDDPNVLVEGPPGAIKLWFQTVPEAKVVKNRLHLDLSCADFEAEHRRLLALGAVDAAGPPVPSLVVMQDPEGNELCLLRQ